MPGNPPRWVRLLGAAAAAGLAAFTAHALLPDAGRVATFFDDGVYYVLLAIAVAIAVARPLLVRRDRLAWSVLAAGIVSYAAAEATYALWIGDLADPPYPSVADALWLGFYACAYVGLALLFRRGVAGTPPGLWLDGIAAALAATALGTAVLLQLVLSTTSGSLAVVATNLSYPLADALLLGLVAGTFAVTGWRAGRAWLLILASILVGIVGDAAYVVLTATGGYVEGSLIDVAWPATLLLLSYAAWQPDDRRLVDLAGRSLLAMPAVAVAIAVAILVVDHDVRVNRLAIVLSAATLIVVVMRLALTFRENARLLARARTEAVTDPLTGLGNRRRLMSDLDRVLDEHDGAQWLLVIFDLDGFKSYNDSFGHPTGDALLQRLGAELGRVPGPDGAAYRLGGDEFCLLVPAADGAAERLLDRASAALTEHGEGFTVTSSFGAVFLPTDADEPREALRVADARLYAQKRARRSRRERPQDALLQALYERDPELQAHLEGVAELAVAIGRALGLDEHDLDLLHRAAQLHDIGKIAIPDGILRKTGPLDDAEWRFIRRHTLVGERILVASPALREVALIVRSSHERWDGAGYPDGLAGEEIPLAARIVFACDAFDAMTGERPYRPARTVAEALAELERCAGSQFDPAVVRELAAVLAGRSAHAASAASSAATSSHGRAGFAR